MKKRTIYQILTRVFNNPVSANIPNGSIQENGCGKMESFTSSVLNEIKENGYTDIWFTGLLAHASRTDYSGFGIPKSHSATVKGRAGSPYAIRDYYDIDPDIAVNISNRMDEFANLVGRVHDAGLGFIMDFVPNHVARQYHSISTPKGKYGLGESDNPTEPFSTSNNFYYFPGQSLGGSIDWQGYVENPAKATGNDRFSPWPSECDWYETVKLNYGIDYRNGNRHFDPIPDTWIKMTDILLFWASKGVDAFRCDMAEMVPVEFWHFAIAKVKSKYKKVEFIAEIYNPGSYSSYVEYGGFDWLYDKVGLYDTLRAIVEGRESATAITRCWQNTGQMGPHMLHFMENHDEQRIASDFFAGNPEKALPAMVVSALMDSCPVMVYAGQELGERGMDTEGFSGRDGRTTIFDYWSPDTLHRLYSDGHFGDSRLTEQEKQLRSFYSRLMNIARSERCVSNGRFFDLMYVNPVSGQFNPHRTYAFLRADSHHAMLTVANFDGMAVNAAVNIPQHAFDYMQLTARNACLLTDLISGNTQRSDISPERPVRVSIPPYSAAVLRWKI